MNPADLMGLPTLFDLLAETTLAASAALLLVLLLRRPLRRAFGATVAYATWALVPAAVVAVLLPAATVVSTPVTMTLNAAVVPMAALPAAMPIDYAPWLIAAWLLGAALMVLRLGRQQRAFRRGLGRLRPRADGLQQAETVAGLPAALGLLRPAIVVPADFDTRYSNEERQLMRAHERNHIVRGDLQINALVALLRSVFWFNPLLHYASRHFRHDQELACDQRVIACHPHARRAYGEAMFKTQLATQQPLPLGCHWAAFPQARSHPLKERIAMLKQPVPTVARWIGGSTLVLTLALGVGFAAWSAQPKSEVLAASRLPAGALMAQMDVSIDGGKPQRFTMINEPGQPFSMHTTQGGQQWELQATASPDGNGMIAIDSTLSRDGKVLGSPKLRVRDGELAAIKIGEQNAGSGAFEGITLEMMVTAAVPPVPPVPAVPAVPPMAPMPPIASLPPLPPLPETGIAPAPPQAGVAPRVPSAPSLGAVVNRTPAPRYPAGALAKGIGGKVVLVIDIDAQGKPVDIRIERSEPTGVFDQAAIDAAKLWQFQPPIEHGKPVASRVQVPVWFVPPRPAAKKG